MVFIEVDWNNADGDISTRSVNLDAVEAIKKHADGNAVFVMINGKTVWTAVSYRAVMETLRVRGVEVYKVIPCEEDPK